MDRVDDPATFDWKNPDYSAVFRERIRRLQRMRADPAMVPGLRKYYAEHIPQFITDWGCTSDPRNAEINLPVVLPFILFPRQIEWIEWVQASWRARRPGVTAKSRDMGVSWMAVGLSCSLCIFNEGMVIGFGSAKAELIDKLGDPKALFWKAREFMALLPREFRGTWTRGEAPQKLIKFPDTGSVIMGEGGDNIGRGARASLYFVDESAHLEHQMMADAALSATTNCRIDVSSVKGTGNPFHKKFTTWPQERVFRFHWREDPRKSEEWYESKRQELDPVILAQEYDIDFSASVEGRLIPSEWVQAAIDAHAKLGIAPSGKRGGAFDVADEGRDKCAFVGAHGIVVDYAEDWSGVGDDIFRSVQRAFEICDERDYREFRYDGDGLGAGVRGDARIINDGRTNRRIEVTTFRGSAGVFRPEAEDVAGRKNKDHFLNAKAQAGWGLRERFQRTFRWVKEGVPCDPDEIISISSTAPNYQKLAEELSQPVYDINGAGKKFIVKAGDGERSPNLYDALMMRFAPLQMPMRISQGALMAAGGRR